jgi:hypothetical protein
MASFSWPLQSLASALGFAGKLGAAAAATSAREEEVDIIVYVLKRG